MGGAGTSGDMGRRAVRTGLAVFSGVLATDQAIKAAGAAAGNVERVLSVNPGIGAMGVAAFAVTAALLIAVARSGMASPLAVGLVLGGIGSSLIDGLATGATSGVSLADVAVGVGVGLGVTQAIFRRPFIFGRSHRLIV
jgi:hypothetical protein